MTLNFQHSVYFVKQFPVIQSYVAYYLPGSTRGAQKLNFKLITTLTLVICKMHLIHMACL